MTALIKRFVGVDPGRDGAIAVLDENGKLLYLGDVLSADNYGLDELKKVLSEAVGAGETVCAVERPIAFPGIHGSVLIILTFAAGAAVAAATVLGARVETPTASSWKHFLNLPKDKNESVARARELFGADLPKRCRHDKCEAALLAYWAYKKNT